MTFTAEADHAGGDIAVTVPGAGTFNVTVAPDADADTIATAVAEFLDSGFTAFGATSVAGVVTIEWVEVGEHPLVTAVPPVAAEIAVASDTLVEGVDAESGIGFAGLENVLIEGEGGATAVLEDVYGEFALMATASDGNVDVDLVNTGVTSVDLVASEDAYFDILGDTIGAANLVSVDVNAGVYAAGWIENAGEVAVNVVATEDDVDLKIETSALTEATIKAGTNADVDFVNNTGAATVLVEAGSDANVVIAGGGIVFATVNAGLDEDAADQDADVDVFDAVDLEQLTVSAADTAVVDLEGTLDSFQTLDITGVVVEATVDAGAADYAAAPGSIEYLIGATETVIFTTDKDNGAREVFAFVGEDIGDVTIDGFGFDIDGADPERDAIDLSDFGISSSASLNFADVGGHLAITAADGQFDGKITILDLGAFATEFALYNIL